jgi:hypothetical protein
MARFVFKQLTFVVWLVLMFALVFPPGAGAAPASGDPLPPATDPGKPGPEPDFFGAVLPVDANANSQTLPAVAWSPICDKFFVVDQSFVNGVDNNIFGRYVASSGLALGLGPVQLTANPAEQRAPSVAAIPGFGRYMVVWQDLRGGNWNIFARLWDCQEGPLSPEIQVTVNVQAQTTPDVVCGYDLCWVVWQDLRAGNWDIYGQRLSTGGAFIGVNMPLSVDPTAQTLPAIAYNPLPTGCGVRSFLAVWQDARNAGTAPDVFGQQLDNFGPCGGNVAVNADLGAQRDPDVAFGTMDGRYQVVWTDYRNGGADIYGVMTFPTGVPAGAPFTLSIAAGDQARPAVAFDDVHDQFLTVWQDIRTGNWDIYGQRTTGLGALIGGNFLIAASANPELNPAVAFAHTTAHYFVAWDDKTNILGRAYWP